jgi:hypothetical protein
MPCTKQSDEHSTLYHVPAFVPQIKNLKHMVPRPPIEVWWDRDAKRKDDEDLLIRQDNGDKADVITLTLGQAYDLIHALGSLIMDK